MSSQRYERVAPSDDVDSPVTPTSHQNNTIPSSPPPSFRSRPTSPSSRRLLTSQDPLASEADQALADSFDAPSDDEGSGDEKDGDDRIRLIHGRGSPSTQPDPAEGYGPHGYRTRRPPAIERRVTQFPAMAPELPAAAPGRVYGGGSHANDGVFANLSAKPEKGEKVEEFPPTYEQAAADATPPYWETTVLAPGMNSDDVFIDGLPVGSVFSFAWNGMISMSFQLVGFLLTYLLHTSHAAKNGSRAGLGITLVQYGFYMKGTSTSTGDSGGQPYGQPPDPNSHDFDPNAIGSDSSAAAIAAMVDAGNGNTAPGATSSIGTNDWLAYGLMVVGWFILIRAISDFIKARRHEQLVLQSPDRGLGIPVVAEGERAETVV